MKIITLLIYDWSTKLASWSWTKLYKNRNSIGYKNVQK
jgi:hypothetical protein